MPELKAQYDEHFILHYPDGEPAKNLKYLITAEDGQIFEGISDEEGKTLISAHSATSPSSNRLGTLVEVEFDCKL